MQYIIVACRTLMFQAQVFLLQVIKRQLEEGVERRRIGLVSKGAPARQHSDILTEDGEKVLVLPYMTRLGVAQFRGGWPFSGESSDMRRQLMQSSLPFWPPSAGAWTAEGRQAQPNLG